MTPDPAAMFHDLVDVRFDDDHTGTSEFRATCACPARAERWGATKDAAKGAHREHRAEVAERLVLSWRELRDALVARDWDAAVDPLAAIAVALGIDPGPET